MLFKGTKKRTPREIGNRLESLGGDLNAYTTKEETVIYATTLKEDLRRSADLLFELAFTSTFPEKELQKERSIVIDEINMYKDSPSECIFDDYEELLFDGHPLSRSILGTAKSLKRITSDDIREYVMENFTPGRMCISIVADIPLKKAEKIAMDAACAYLPEEYGIRSMKPHQVCGKGTGAPSVEGARFWKEVQKKNHQVNCIVGATAYNLYDERRVALILLTNILGGPSSNSRLNMVLREKNALVYSVDCSYSQYSDAGSLMICFGCEKANLERCLDLIKAELATLRDSPMSDKAVRAAKRQLLGQMGISSDMGESQTLSLGKSMLAYGTVLSSEEIRRKIEEVTSSDLMDAARTILSEERLSTLIYR